MIEVSRLTKDFSGYLAVNDISFEVRPGEVLGFLGPNGAGKSTTMKMVAGFIRPSGGTVSVMGHNVVHRPMAAKRQIGYLPEGAPLYGDMSVSDFLNFVARMREVPANQRAAVVSKAKSQLQLEAVANKRIEDLSKGFKRRVGIAQAILHDPAVLILDEPTDGLDPNQKHQVRQLIRNLAADKIVILSTHILEEVSAVCNRAVVIAGGRLVADETPQDLQAQSRYHQAVTLQMAAGTDLEAIEHVLLASQNIESVERASDQPMRLCAIPCHGQVIHQEIASIVNDRGWKITSLYVESGSLDDVFRKLTIASDTVPQNPDFGDSAMLEHDGKTQRSRRARTRSGRNSE